MEYKTREWKERNKRYIEEVRKFLDKVANVKDETLRLSLIYQMLKCDNILTEISEQMFNEYYIKGKNDAKKS